MYQDSRGNQEATKQPLSNHHLPTNPEANHGFQDSFSTNQNEATTPRLKLLNAHSQN